MGWPGLLAGRAGHPPWGRAEHDAGQRSTVEYEDTTACAVADIDGETGSLAHRGHDVLPQDSKIDGTVDRLPAGIPLRYWFEWKVTDLCLRLVAAGR
jgi:hypothetical protein